MSQRVAIIGAGMAGYGTAHRLEEAGVRPVIYEQRDHYGGHTATYRFEAGFTFDEGPHISFTSDPRMQKLLADSVDGEYETAVARVNNYWRGHWIKHPVQANLHGLPTDLVISVIRDFVRAMHGEPGPINDYEDWLRATFGDTLAETFPMEYTRKNHTTDARNLSTDWIGPRLYRPSLEEVLEGALSPETPDVHYITEFRYPKEGGFVSYLRRFMEQADVQLSHRVVGVDPRRRELRFASGARAPFDRLISSAPLPELIAMVDGVPSDVLDAASRLAASEVVVVNLGIDRPDVLDAHWTYFYDPDILMARLSTPYLQSARNVPPGMSSLQAECYFSAKYRPLDMSLDEVADCVVKDLTRTGILREDDRIVVRHAVHVAHANVIFDHDRADAVAVCHGFLDDLGIGYAGRYGEWGYLWTDESFVSGERAADRLLSARRH
jgi:protoporphyrinogen oxidase